MSVDPRRLKELFLGAPQIPDRANRDAWLAQQCGQELDLLAKVQALLKARDNPESFLDLLAPPVGVPQEEVAQEPCPAPAALVATIDDPMRERPGTVIGPYKLMEQIGEGGMGLVFVAEQQQPVRRRVALKVIKPGMDSRQVVARFEAERQALALLDHANIAQVYDGGATPEGRPYFVMELVKGTPITDYCDVHRLTTRQRLELFGDVCQAVQHAHQKGIIHRDLKPSNVLVMSHDGTPVVKVIDFGVAKSIGQQLTDKTISTQFTQMVGTPLYMSPEQAGGSGLDVDTRTDIYALGVLLYELLTGTTPFDQERLREVGYEEMRRIIREEEPPRPSTRVSTLGQAAATIATQGQSDPKQLSQLFRSELDWIVMKALEKDRNHRYETANALASDVQRYLHDEPVQACPPSASYRFGKFTRRHRMGLVLAASVLALVLGLAGSTVWLTQQRAIRLAETDRTVTAALAQAKVLLQEGDKQIDHPERWQATARLALAAVEKAEEVLAAGVATEELAARVRQVRQAVDVAVTDSQLLVQLDQIRLEKAAVNVKENRFEYARAAPLYKELLGNYGVDLAAPETAATRVRDSRLRDALLSALADWEWSSQDEGERQRVAKVYDLALPPDSLRPRLVAAIQRRDLPEVAKLAQASDLPSASLVKLAADLTGMKEWAGAELLLRAGLDRRPGDFWLNHDLGLLLHNQQPPRAEEAVRYLTAALALRPDSPGVHFNLGLALLDKGDVEGAIRCYQAALRISPEYATAHNSLGNALRAKGQLDEALAEYREAIRIEKDYPQAHNNLGNALRAKGQLDEALAEYREAIRTKKDFPEAYIAHYNLGLALRAKGQLDEAIAEFHEAIRIKKDYAEAHYNLGNALTAKGLLDEAIAAYKEAIRLKKDYPQAHNNLGNALKDKGRLDEALAEYREAIRTKKDFPEAYKAHNILGNALTAKGQLDDAIAEYRETIRIQKDYAEAHCNLGLVLVRQGKFRQAMDEFRLGHEFGSKNPRWPYPSARWLRDAERFADLDVRLPKILKGEDQPVDANERVALALLCQRHKKLYATAAHWYSKAFATQPALAEKLGAQGSRYDAACAAALAACGQGEDAKSLDDKERARLRQQALDWLRAELEAWGKRLEKEAGKTRPVVVQQLQHWLGDPDFAGVRGEEALAKLPEPEHQAWQKLWSDVEALRTKAGRNKK
jgi:serine/threonine protein kinase/tetratricopeptide (TPR) repeat protein